MAIAIVVKLEYKVSQIKVCEVIIPKIKMDLAKACTIKYFIILLIDKLFLLNIRGINAIILTSNAAHS
ncbi:hypothetical protein [Herbaspirillum sp. ST 5-3]|uniref:hypothetical protein n=1 Tax=Herbaspirillum sp. ST 5-3 TaxID=2567936 RepID=UPI0014560D4E|nr:hypothetical protein [Herbaspirillum sp. ST 5-3]